MAVPASAATTLLLLLAGGAAGGLVPTPFGHRPAECVVEVPDGSHVEEHEGRLRVSHPVLGERLYEVPASCHEERHQPRRRVRAPAWGQRCDLNPAGKNCSCDAPPCTCAALPCNSWIDNAGLWTHPQALGGFSAVYSVPATPPASGPGQCLFWFIGTENTDGLPRHGVMPAPGRTILQPVLTYNPSGWCQNSSTGWCMSSWNCCPANVTTHSPYLLDVKPGETYFGMFNQTSPGVFEVVSRNTKTGKQTALKASGVGRLFNWADVTLEVYDITSCALFASGPVTFSQMELWDTEAKPIASSDWLLTSPKPCGGSVTRVGVRTIAIQHSPEHGPTAGEVIV